VADPGFATISALRRFENYCVSLASDCAGDRSAHDRALRQDEHHYDWDRCDQPG